jgi:thiol-disulfide isomerase/thioredoxin
VENATLYAPDLPRGFPWINTPRPLTLRELRGRLVLVHFWCSSSVECTQMLPMLRAFEERHRNDPVVVIGVHSARLDGEREIERVEDAVRRHDIRHPVLVDSDLQVWRAYGVEQWPTIAVVRPDSTLATVAPGEPSVEALERFLREELRRGRDKAQLTEVPLQYLAEPAPPCGPLSFPGGVAVSRHGRVAVSDTANHRVLVFDAAGDLALIAGSGDDGHVDGAVGEARLSEPKGLAFDGDGRVLFVADPGNHTVRRIDLDAGRVTTLAGTGALGEAALRPRQRYAGAATALRSPTGVALGDGSLFISLAGSHQVATVDARSGELALLAGTGEVSCVDGGIDAATFGQPTGLSLSGRSLFVADAENSAVRRVDLDLGAVDTIVGSGAFDFGYEDGPRSRALLQRCLDVAALPDGNTLLVADAYNGRLRRRATPPPSRRRRVTWASVIPAPCASTPPAAPPSWSTRPTTGSSRSGSTARARGWSSSARCRTCRAGCPRAPRRCGWRHPWPTRSRCAMATRRSPSGCGRPTAARWPPTASRPARPRSRGGASCSR